MKFNGNLSFKIERVDDDGYFKVTLNGQELYEHLECKCYDYVRDLVDSARRVDWLFAVEFTNHDHGSRGGKFVRPTLELAKRSADMMTECGYKRVSVTAFPAIAGVLPSAVVHEVACQLAGV